MYNQFFGLRKAPFHLTPDPEFLYLTTQHREVLAGLSYAILARKGFVVLTGDAGTGKTTLLTRIFQNWPVSRIQSSIIVNPTLTPAEFIEATLLDFGFQSIPATKPQRLAELQKFLWRGHQEGKISALVIDEAHKLSPEVLEEIRLLGNFESADQKLLQIVLVGQRELDALLNCEHLRQLKQRVAIRLTLDPLHGSAEVERYIGHRWAKAGGSHAPFAPEALAGILQASQGIPRTINVVCDNALMQAFGESSARVEARHVLAVCRDLHLAAAVPPAAPAPPVAAPVPVPAPVPPVEEFPMNTLRRYSKTASHTSVLARLAGKLGLTQRTETA